MVRVLVAGLIALVISIAAGPKFIDFLRRNEYGQHIREEGPSHHIVKRGTPTMGGLLIVLAAALAILPLTFYTLPAQTVLFTTGACAAARSDSRAAGRCSCCSGSRSSSPWRRTTST